MAGASVPRGIETWLATPEAANLLDPSHLQGRDREEWASVQTARRRRDWASSRALLGAAAVTGDQSSSLSHSRGYAALALAPGAVAVGVDLEWLAPREFRGMADVAYSPVEYELLASLGDPQELSRDVLRALDAEGSLRQGTAPALGGRPAAVPFRRRRVRPSRGHPDDAALAGDGLRSAATVAAGGGPRRRCRGTSRCTARHVRVAPAAHQRLDRDPQPLERRRLMRVITCAPSPAKQA